MLGFDHHKVNYTLGARGLGATELSDESAKVSRRKVARKKISDSQYWWAKRPLTSRVGELSFFPERLKSASEVSQGTKTVQYQLL